MSTEPEPKDWASIIGGAIVSGVVIYFGSGLGLSFWIWLIASGIIVYVSIQALDSATGASTGFLLATIVIWGLIFLASLLGVLGIRGSQDDRDCYYNGRFYECD